MVIHKAKIHNSTSDYYAKTIQRSKQSICHHVCMCMAQWHMARIGSGISGMDEAMVQLIGIVLHSICILSVVSVNPETTRKLEIATLFSAIACYLLQLSYLACSVKQLSYSADAQLCYSQIFGSLWLKQKLNICVLYIYSHAIDHAEAHN